MCGHGDEPVELGVQSLELVDALAQSLRLAAQRFGFAAQASGIPQLGGDRLVRKLGRARQRQLAPPRVGS
jgi:hypothetical protein